MTKSEIFKSAHKLAKETVSNFQTYRLAFSSALKLVYSEPKEKTEEEILFIWVKASCDCANGAISSEERTRINSELRKKYGRLATRNIKNYPSLVQYRKDNLPA